MRTLSKMTLLLFAVLIVAGTSGVARADHSIGGGIHYLRNLGDLKTSGGPTFDQNSFSLLASGQTSLVMLRLEADVEYIFDYIGTGHPMWQPEAWVLTSGLIYAGAGIGIGYTDGDWQKDPFYALRAGVNLGLAGFGVDAFASYRFQNDSAIKSLTGDDLNSITFAAIARFGL